MTNPWVRERFALTALEYPIPARSNRFDFMLGALTLVALTLLAVTGIVLTQFYDPTPLGAHASVRYAITSLPLVTLIRAVEALAHAMAGAQVAGPLGAPFQPDFTPSSPLLTRMYGLHVAVLPIVLVALLSLHLWLVRHLGVSAGGDAQVPFRTHLRPLGGFAS